MSKEHQAECLRQWFELLEEGYNLQEMLMIYRQFSGEEEAAWILDMEEGLNEGEWISGYLENAGFQSEVISIVLFAEKYGELSEGLKRATDLLDSQIKITSEFKKVFHYPLFLSIGFIVITSVLVQGIFPRFDEFFRSMGSELPRISTITFQFFRYLPLFIGIFIIAVITIIIILYYKVTPIRRLHILVKIPLINGYVQSYVTYQLIAKLKPLLTNGFSLKDSLNVIGSEDRIVYHQVESNRIRECLLEGSDLSDALGNSSLYLPQFVHIVKMGESKGNIAHEMDRFSRIVFRRIQKKFSGFLVWFQPVFFLLLGSLMVMLFASLLLPVFSVLDQW
ncbi:competence type IV pilus assembly protein ComGB [Salisediminibacterium beveridgei]|nr:competence type IV pilus assembly protein ComGB [Salisediminibacterium beveridgei]